MNKTHEEFLKEGVGCYIDALATLERFQAEMPRRIEQVLRDRTDWKSFTPSQKRTAFDNDTGKGTGYGYWSYALLYGKFKNIKQEVIIEIGVWWEPYKLNLPAIFYAGINTGPESVKKYTPHLSKSRIKYFHCAGKTWLYVEPGAEIDFNQDFNELLDELLKQISLCE